MSVEADSPDHELSVEELLLAVIAELKLLNAKVEAGYETGIDPEDIDDDDN